MNSENVGRSRVLLPRNSRAFALEREEVVFVLQLRSLLLACLTCLFPSYKYYLNPAFLRASVLSCWNCIIFCRPRKLAIAFLGTARKTGKPNGNVLLYGEKTSRQLLERRNSKQEQNPLFLNSRASTKHKWVAETRKTKRRRRTTRDMTG